MKPIRSIHNPRFKAAVQLTRSRGRKHQAEFLIQGGREVGRAFSAGVEIRGAFCTPTACTAEERQVVQHLESRGIPLWEVPLDLLERLHYGETQTGLVAVAAAFERGLADLQLGANPLIVVCDHLEKPGNVGAIVRTADAVGATAVILADPLVDCFHPNVLRASTGCVFSMPLATAKGTAVRTWLLAEGFTIFAADPAADTAYSDLDFPPRTAVVFGNEAHGLSPVWRGAGLTTFRLPMAGVADSLNVSVTAAVVLFEVRRRRTASSS